MLKLSDKQKQFFKEADARINIMVGAVRSGKTFVSLLKWLEFVPNAPKEGDLVITGRTASTIKRNVINELFRIIGDDARFFGGKGELKLWGRTIHLIPANDERAEGKIRGVTFGGAYVDEITLLPESYWTILLSRLSPKGAKLFGTTNPDSPFHWLKVNYLDRADKLDLKSWNFLLDDNPSLDDNFKASLRSEYRGLWHKRYILGEWCLAEGSVYDFFDYSEHTINYSTNIGKEFYVGVDYGTTNPCAFVMVAYNPFGYPNMWVEKEYYYDSTEHNRQKTDSEYANDLKKFVEGYPINAIYMDPSAASFKLECQRTLTFSILDADNEVLDGIRFVSSLFINGTLKICRNCTNLIKEVQSYCWDVKSRELGIDRPLKKNDHLLDSARYILYTKFGKHDTTTSMTPDDLDKIKREAKMLGYY